MQRNVFDSTISAELKSIIFFPFCFEVPYYLFQFSYFSAAEYIIKFKKEAKVIPELTYWINLYILFKKFQKCRRKDTTRFSMLKSNA